MLGVGDDRHVDRRAAPVLDGVVEEGPQHLVELVGVGDRQPAIGIVVEPEGHLGCERLPRAAGSGSQAHDFEAWTQRARLEPCHREELADHA